MADNIKQIIAKAKRAAVADRLETKNRKVQNITPDKLSVLITVVARKKAEYYIDIIQSFEVNMQMTLVATGTANASMISLLGLTDLKKSVIISVIKDNKLNDCLATLENKFNTIAGGKGIAFTIPMTSVIGTLIYGFLSNNLMIKEGN